MTSRKHSPPARSRRAPRRQRQTPPPGQGDARWLYGVHAVLAALANPNRRCHRLLVAPDTARRLGDRLAGLTSPDSSLGAEGESASRGEIARFLPAGAVHQGLALEVEPLPGADLKTACSPTPEGANRVVVLDGVTDPQNVGAIMRSAAAFGVRALVLTRRHAPPVTGALAKAASGALESVALVRVNNLARSLDALAELGYWRLGLDIAAATPLETFRPGPAVALVLGAEDTGLRRLTAGRCDELVQLPIAPLVQSLNVSHAAAIALYELARKPLGD
jgi:23S rRNA (guanosine2251-2'-O)-methyltransferase